MSQKPTKRALHQLTRQEHAMLRARGILKEHYPKATGEWDKDSVAVSQPEEKERTVHLSPEYIEMLNQFKMDMTAIQNEYRGLTFYEQCKANRRRNK